MITISLCMIVKNEEAVLGRCLDSIRPAVEEIVIVDTGSTDRTIEIARTYTEKVLSFGWIDDFSAARNYAYEQATMDYQLWLDADDVLPPEELEKLLVLKGTLDPKIDMVTMKYHTHVDDQGKPILTSTRERLTKRSRGFRWQDPVHECIPLQHPLLHSEITIWHKKPPSTEVSTRNLEIYQKMEAMGKLVTPRHEYYFARELRDHGQFDKAAQYFKKFLEGGQGWLEDNIATCQALAACYRALGKPEEILPNLLRSFTFAPPRGEICCDLGYYYKERGDWRSALQWFQVAAHLDPKDCLGFIRGDYWGYVPYVESCVCCSNLGEFERANQYNELAATYKPDSVAVHHNRAFLATKLNGAGAQ